MAGGLSRGNATLPSTLITHHTLGETKAFASSPETIDQTLGFRKVNTASRFDAKTFNNTKPQNDADLATFLSVTEALDWAPPGPTLGEHLPL